MSSPSGLPDLTFVERDAATIEANFLTQIEAKLSAAAGQPVTLALGDPRRALISGIVALFVQERQNINITGRLNLIGYSFGEYIIEAGKLVLGDKYPLLEASKALTTIRFTLSAARAEVTTIPSGTLVAAGTVQFATMTTEEIGIGDLFVDVTAEAVVAGTSGNGFAAGQIKTMVQPIPFVAIALNTTTSQGGAEQETEDAYRERVRSAPSAYSTAGPEQAYIFWAKTASTAIADVSVTIDVGSPGAVYIRPLLVDGEIPGAEVLALVATAVSDKTRRPLTDSVSVLAPTAESYDVAFTYYIDEKKSAQAITIQAAVDAAVVEYRAWQRAALGRDINPDMLRSMVIAAGAKRLVVTSPTYAVLTNDKVAASGTVTVTYGGLEDA